MLKQLVCGPTAAAQRPSQGRANAREVTAVHTTLPRQGTSQLPMGLHGTDQGALEGWATEAGYGALPTRLDYTSKQGPLRYGVAEFQQARVWLACT